MQLQRTLHEFETALHRKTTQSAGLAALERLGVQHALITRATGLTISIDDFSLSVQGLSSLRSVQQMYFATIALSLLAMKQLVYLLLAAPSFSRNTRVTGGS